MKRFLCVLCVSVFFSVSNSQAQVVSNRPLRVLLLGGPKTHGEGEHNHPLWVRQWSKLLKERKAKTQSSMTWPTAKQFAWADVLAMYRADGGELSDAQQKQLAAFMERGGGLVVLHDAVCCNHADMFKTFTGGAWQHGKAKYYTGEVDEYFVDRTHPITRGAQNFHINDEIYWDLEMQPFARVLAVSWLEPAFLRGVPKNEVFKQVPQMWTYERGKGRAFVWLIGHFEKTFDLPNVRALMLRGIAWVGAREVDSLTTAAERRSLEYPAGGPTAPEEAAKKIRVPEGFKLDLVAGEPDVVKPISMVFDARGRMWVAETVEYPWPGDQKNTHDRIVILDLDKNHRVKSRKVFADGLDIPTSVLLYRDGCLVMQTPYIMWLRDTDGDGVADKREYLFTGFTRPDTHGTISNMVWGLDGWVYATQGYNRSQIRRADENGKATGPVLADFAAGVFRFKPDGSAIEFLTATQSNTWGCGFDASGELFFSKANGAHVNHLVIPNRYLERVRGLDVIGNELIEDHNKSHCICPEPFHQIDWVGNFTGASGATIYTADAWPEEYRGNYFVTEPTIHIVHRDVLIPKGATFTAHSPSDDEFIASTDPWFRPIHTVIGPDGAMYILDFYNQAIIHNDTRRGGPGSHAIGSASVRPDRDHEHGRIWRLQWEGAPKPMSPAEIKEKFADPGNLLQSLAHPNQWIRLTAQRLIVESGDHRYVGSLQGGITHPNNELVRLHALWILEQLDSLKETQLIAALSDSSSMVRKNAARIAESRKQPSENLLAALTNSLTDKDPLVQRDVTLTLANLQSSSSQMNWLSDITIMEAAVLRDRWMRTAVLAAAVRDGSEFIKDVLEPKHLIKAPAENEVSDVLGRVALDLGARGDAQAAAKLVIVVAEANSAPGLRPAKWKAACLKNLSVSLPPNVKPTLDEPLKKAMIALLTGEDDAVRAAALPLAARWDEGGQLRAALQPILDKMLAQVRDPNADEKTRAVAVGSLLSTSPNDLTVEAVATLLTPSESPALQTETVRALGKTPTQSVGAVLLRNWQTYSPALRAEILNVVLKRPEWTAALLDAIAAETVRVGDLPATAVARLRENPDPAVAGRAKRMLAKSRPEETNKAALIAKLRPLVATTDTSVGAGGKGDPARGKEVYEKNCAVCHKLDGKGVEVAPDLTGIGINGPEWLLEQIVDPNAQIEGGYVAYNVETKSGETYTGIVASENAVSVTLKFSGGQQTVPREQIAKFYSTGKSLMPEGMEAVGEKDLRDLLTFLAGDSRFIALDLSRVANADGRHGLFASKGDGGDNLAFDKYGVVTIEGVPFRLLDPATTGANLIELYGGPEPSVYSRTFPMRVEVPCGQSAKTIHVLSGVGGWASPWLKDESVVITVRLHFAGGEVQEVNWLNGKHFADYIGPFDVPDSKPALRAHGNHQLRYLTIKPDRDATIETIEFVKNKDKEHPVAPIIAAITVEKP